MINRCSPVLLYLQENSITAVRPTLLSNQRLDYCWVREETLVCSGRIQTVHILIAYCMFHTFSSLSDLAKFITHTPTPVLAETIFCFIIQWQNKTFHNSFGCRVSYCFLYMFCVIWCLRQWQYYMVLETDTFYSNCVFNEKFNIISHFIGRMLYLC